MTRWGGWCPGGWGDLTVGLIWGGEGNDVVLCLWHAFSFSPVYCKLLDPEHPLYLRLVAGPRTGHTQFCSSGTWNWRGKWLFILALNSADHCPVLSLWSGDSTTDFSAEEEGWGGGGECVSLCVCLSWEERWSCGGRVFLNCQKWTQS